MLPTEALIPTLICRKHVLINSSACPGPKVCAICPIIAAGALIFGQACAGKFNTWLFALGFVFVVVAYTLGDYLLKPAYILILNLLLTCFQFHYS